MGVCVGVGNAAAPEKSFSLNPSCQGFLASPRATHPIMGEGFRASGSGLRVQRLGVQDSSLASERS